jgi:predicted nucleic acid-binding protein
MPVLVDSNVLIDVMQGGDWADWSSAALAEAADRGAVVINQIIYAEVACGFETVEELDEALARTLIDRENVPWEAGFLVARAFLDHRRRGGARSAPLPDFFIGAHALVGRHQLLTRDAARYQTYFPRLEIISPRTT